MRSLLILALAVTTLGCTASATDNSPAAPATNQNQMSGIVLETNDAATYTYIRFETLSGEAWAAVPRARLEVGDDVVIVNPQPMENFESKTLGRTFETIYFGTLAGQGVAAPTTQRSGNPHGSMSGGMGSGGHAAPGPVDAPIDVARADGAAGRTIAELYAEKGDLSGKTVAVRGKVVKYSAGIMGRNWIHLQDGTGEAGDGTNDITVTSSGATAVGDVILVEGIVAVDKDFGAGYRYAVIVEEARLE